MRQPQTPDEALQYPVHSRLDSILDDLAERLADHAHEYLDITECQHEALKQRLRALLDDSRDRPAEFPPQLPERDDDFTQGGG